MRGQNPGIRLVGSTLLGLPIRTPLALDSRTMSSITARSSCPRAYREWVNVGETLIYHGPVYMARLTAMNF